MPYTKYPPSQVLKEYVTAYYLWESEKWMPSPISIKSAANGCCAMVLNFGSPYYLSNNQHTYKRLPRQFLSGYSSSPYTLWLEGQISMAGIIFKGSAFRNLFCIPNPQEFMDDRIDLQDILGLEAIELTEQLAEATSDLLRIHILENFLLGKLQRNTKSLTLTDRATSLILDNRGMIRMDNLAEQLCISPRQFRRKFKDRMGISPKYFARLKRFNFVNLCLTNDPDLSWKRFLSEEGYYDQSHFIRDFHEFFGEKPSIQLKENREMVLHMGTAD